MGLLKNLAYSLLTIVVGLLFTLGVLVQAFVSLSFGAVITAFAVLLHLIKEASKIYELLGSGSGTIASAKEKAGRTVASRALSGVAGFLFIYLFRDLFFGKWIIFLVNEALFVAITIIPFLVILLLPEDTR